MIDPKNLQFGNIIFEDEGAIAVVTGLAPFDHTSQCNQEEGCDVIFDIYSQDGQTRFGYVASSKCCSPVPISDRWLDILGFVKRPDKDSIWQHGRLTIWLGHSGCLCYLTHEDHDNANYYIPNGGISFVHELQNLYYWLYKKELVLNSINTI